MRWPRWWELLAEAGLAAGLLVFLIDEPDAATSALGSGKALALMGATALVWLGGRLAAARWVPWAGVRLGAFAVAAAAILAVVVLPAYDDDTVVETFPAAAPAPTSTAPTPPPSPTTTTGTAPEAAVPVAPATTAPPTTTAPPPTAPPPEPELVRTGGLEGIDHDATGTVALYRNPDGTWFVGLEDFDIQPGPDYDLYVVPGEDRHSPGDGVSLGDLRGNRGTQYYDVSGDTDLAAGAWTVLVWCQTFGVPVANATPA